MLPRWKKFVFVALCDILIKTIKERRGRTCGKFAVRKIKTVNGKLDYQNDGDQILIWNETTGAYELFYQEVRR